MQPPGHSGHLGGGLSSSGVSGSAPARAGPAACKRARARAGGGRRRKGCWLVGSRRRSAQASKLAGRPPSQQPTWFERVPCLLAELLLPAIPFFPCACGPQLRAARGVARRARGGSQPGAHQQQPHLRPHVQGQGRPHAAAAPGGAHRWAFLHGHFFKLLGSLAACPCAFPHPSAPHYLPPACRR